MTGRAILRLSPIALLVVVAACGGGVSSTGTLVRAKPPVIVPIYLVRNGKLAPVERAMGVPDAAHLLQALKRGPSSFESRSGFGTAPPGSVLWLAQQVFTLTVPDPTSAVTIHGKRYTRTDFEDETPLIFVESPLPFTPVKSPLRVTGTANTFEATFDYDLVGADGKVLAHHFVTATSGSGVRGTFAFTARFTVPHEEQGKLVVYEVSAKDGSRVHESEIPLTLAP